MTGNIAPAFVLAFLFFFFPCATPLLCAGELKPAGRQPDGLPAFPPGEDVMLPGLSDVGSLLPGSVVELKYATGDNFMGRSVYGGLRRCFLAPDAAGMAARAHRILKQRAPGLTFIFYDCARPRRVQVAMWRLLENTPSRKYVANPFKPPGSLHNRGCAVDIGLYDIKGKKAVDMGSPFDYFGELAEPRAEARLRKEGRLTDAQLANRRLLREVMLGAGFLMLHHEWWHFACADDSTAIRKYAVIE